MKLVILDRDGTINQDSDQYIKSPAEWKPIPGSLEAIARLTQGGWRCVVATNQSGIARGLFDMATLNAIHAEMHRAVGRAGGTHRRDLLLPARGRFQLRVPQAQARACCARLPRAWTWSSRACR
jgi:histidinol-phosphate phosphatase family protein